MKNRIKAKIIDLHQSGIQFDFALLLLEGEVKRSKYFDLPQDIESFPQITVSGYVKHKGG